MLIRIVYTFQPKHPQNQQQVIREQRMKEEGYILNCAGQNVDCNGICNELELPLLQLVRSALPPHHCPCPMPDPLLSLQGLFNRGTTQLWYIEEVERDGR